MKLGDGINTAFSSIAQSGYESNSLGITEGRAVIEDQASNLSPLYFGQGFDLWSGSATLVSQFRLGRAEKNSLVVMLLPGEQETIPVIGMDRS